MKILPLILSGLFATHLSAAPPVTVRGIVIEGDGEIVLDLVADITPGVALRSFGLSIGYDERMLSPVSLGRYNEIWFLSPDGGTTKFPYSDASVVEPGLIEILGARFDGIAPNDGVAGQQVLLGTIRFNKDGKDPDSFEFGLAKAEPFANFTLADGRPIDGELEGLGDPLPTTVIEAPVDEDEDSLPDAYEVITFGGINETSGSEDVDYDGQTNFEEWLAGTDPKDADSKLELVMTFQPDGSKVFEWNGKAGRVYTLNRSGSLEDFNPVLGSQPGVPVHSVTELADGEGRAFYRLKVVKPTSE